MGARPHQIQIHGKHAHARKGQGAGVPRPQNPERKQRERFCPLCGMRYGGDVKPVCVLLDKRTAVIPDWIPARLDGQVVTICEDFCMSVILTGHYRCDGEPEEIIRSSAVYVGGEKPDVGKRRCAACGEVISHGARLCIDCANAIRARTRKPRRLEQAT